VDSDLDARGDNGSRTRVLEHEGDALHDADDMRIHGALNAMQQTKAEIVAALASFDQPPQNGNS
jgi:hypothetical protein